MQLSAVLFQTHWFQLAKSLQAGGAMALLLAHVDTDIIRLIGHWRSDEMLRHLHLQAQPIMRNFASLMLHSGNYYTLLPGQDVPLLDIPNPQQALPFLAFANQKKAN
jgi:hypothetical protein